MIGNPHGSSCWWLPESHPGSASTVLVRMEGPMLGLLRGQAGASRADRSIVLGVPVTCADLNKTMPVEGLRQLEGGACRNFGSQILL